MYVGWRVSLQALSRKSLNTFASKSDSAYMVLGINRLAEVRADTTILIDYDTHVVAA